jgi:hypothetical protein
MHRICVLLLLLPTAAIAVGQSPKQRAGLELFEKKIRPALIEYCFECHATESDDIGGELLLDSRDAILRGGESGPAIVAGKPRDSLFVRAIEYRDLEMPPDERLPDSVIADFRKWISLGAPDPRGESQPQPDQEADQEANDEPVELWSLQPLLVTAPPTVASTWPRSDADRFLRARLQAAGLRPNADAPPATLIRRLYFDLIGLPPSPAEVAQFVADPSEARLEQIVDQLLASEQFGQRWGRHWLDIARYAESAGSSRDVLMLYAWRYRDFVIDAMNADMPFDRFITEQVAGDLLPAETQADKERQTIATGLLAIGSKSLNGGNLTYDVIDDQIDVISKAVLGLTVSCARCHDHKFDPIPTADYYSLAGIFLSTDTRYGGGTKRPKSAKDKANLYLTLGGETQQLLGEEPQYALGVQDAKKITDANILVRGDKGQAGDQVKRGFLSAVGDRCRSDTAPIDSSQSGRVQLAAWLVHPNNPLSPRVAVNRIWQHLHGSGIVETVDNFGVNGLPPSHPQLLDYLADRFVHKHHWSTKSLIRELVLSRTYRQSSEFDEKRYEADPDNRLRWRMPRRRLEAEPLRDAMLSVSGLLDVNRPAGSLVMQIGEGEVGRNINTSVLDEPYHYRSVYLPIIRGIVPEPLKLFDFPEPSNVQGLRASSTTPTQSLFLMNSDFSLYMAGSCAEQLLADPGLKSDGQRVRAAHLRCFASEPTTQQIERDVEFINEMLKRAGKRESDRRRFAWTTYCQSLMASAKFRFID